MEDVTSEMNASNNCVCNFNTTDSFSDVENCSSTVTITGNPWDDATWVLTSAFVIFTMQSGMCLCIYFCSCTRACVCLLTLVSTFQFSYII